jgi:putative inorganic carbon (HCO3(-)) transporter
VLVSRWADLAVPIVAFILYTNAAVIAVHFHGVPFILAASYPLLLLAPIGRDVLIRGEPLLVTPALIYVFALLVVALIGALFAIRPEDSMRGFLEFVLEGAFVYILVASAIRTPAILKQVIWSLIVAGAFLGALVAYQQFTGNYENHFGGFAQLDTAGRGFLLDDVSGADANRQRRLGGPLGKPNRFAQIMAVLVPLALFQFQACRRRATKLLALGALLLILIGCALAFSRGAAVGLALMVLVMVAMGYVALRHLAAMAAAVVLLALLVPQYGRRLSSLVEVAALATEADAVGMANADSSVRGRLTEMITAGLVFADHPIAGVGPRMYREHYMEYARIAGGSVRQGPRQAHSLPLHVAAEHGILGLAALGMALFVTFRELERARRRWRGVRPDLAHLMAGLTLALVVYLTIGLFLHLTYIRYFWFILAVASAAGRLMPEKEGSFIDQFARVIGQIQARGAAGRRTPEAGPTI